MDILQKMGLGADQAKAAIEQADKDIQNGLLSPKKSLLPIAETKAILFEEFNAGRTHISAARLMQILNERGAGLNSSRHIGDLLGNSSSGLRLASTKNFDPKKKNQRFYRIPDPIQFADWYEKGLPVLAKEYYSEDELRIVIAHLRKRLTKGLEKVLSDGK